MNETRHERNPHEQHNHAAAAEHGPSPHMMRHFAIDLLQEYGTEPFPDTQKVVNPAWRGLDRSRNSVQNKLRYRRARFAEMSLHPQSEDDKIRYDKWLGKKDALLAEIQCLEQQLGEVKANLKITPKHIAWAQLEEEDRFQRLLPGRRRLLDTIRMIAYRAETAIVISAQAEIQRILIPYLHSLRSYKADYGANRVIVFGSLAHGAWFTSRSDIDLAVEGIPPDAFFKSWCALERLGSNIEINLIAIESTSEEMSREIGEFEIEH
jgi:predicted nucleotidyltransferase